MTKKELETLHSQKAIIQPVNTENKFVLSMSLSRGELLALHDILNANRDNAIVDDLFAFITNACNRSRIDII